MILISGMLYRIVAPHFVAAIRVGQDGVIIATAPILKWVGNKQFAWFRTYCHKKGWKIEVIG